MNAEELMRKLTKDATRTEPQDYSQACGRLQDQRTVRLLHAAMGMATESGEFLDQLKRHIFYGKEIDVTNIVEEIGDSTWYERIGLDAIDVELLEAIQLNVSKLKARFPDKFTERDAINRDLDNERRILEAGE